MLRFWKGKGTMMLSSVGTFQRSPRQWPGGKHASVASMKNQTWFWGMYGEITHFKHFAKKKFSMIEEVSFVMGRDVLGSSMPKPEISCQNSKLGPQILHEVRGVLSNNKLITCTPNLDRITNQEKHWGHVQCVLCVTFTHQIQNTVKWFGTVQTAPGCTKLCRLKCHASQWCVVSVSVSPINTPGGVGRGFEAICHMS